MRMRIDEAGGDNQSVGVDYLGGAVFDFADFGDFAVRNRDVTLEARRSGTVNDRSIFD